MQQGEGFKKTSDSGLVYIDLGHRCIRTTFSRRSTTLLLENHLVGRDGKKMSIILHQASELKLVYEKWYDIITEVKGDEIVVQIDGHFLYGKKT